MPACGLRVWGHFWNSDQRIYWLTNGGTTSSTARTEPVWPDISWGVLGSAFQEDSRWYFQWCHDAHVLSQQPYPQWRRQLDNWGGRIFISSCSPLLTYFEIDCFYGLSTQIYEYSLPQLSSWRRHCVPRLFCHSSIFWLLLLDNLDMGQDDTTLKNSRNSINHIPVQFVSDSSHISIPMGLCVLLFQPASAFLACRLSRKVLATRNVITLIFFWEHLRDCGRVRIRFLMEEVRQDKIWKIFFRVSVKIIYAFMFNLLFFHAFGYDCMRSCLTNVGVQCTIFYNWRVHGDCMPPPTNELITNSVYSVQKSKANFC